MGTGAKLYFKYGTMGSGKTLNLLVSRHNYIKQGKRVLVYTSSTDTRSGNKRVESRFGIGCDADYVRDNIFEEVKEENEKELVHCVFVDEAQFLTRKDVENLTDIVDELNIPVIAYGLRADFRNELFEGSSALFALADKLEELKTVCCFTNKKATVNMRVDKDGNVIREGEQIVIGDIGGYYPVSRKVYKELKNINEYKSRPYMETTNKFMSRFYREISKGK